MRQHEDEELATLWEKYKSSNITAEEYITSLEHCFEDFYSVGNEDLALDLMAFIEDLSSTKTETNIIIVGRILNGRLIDLIWDWYEPYLTHQKILAILHEVGTQPAAEAAMKFLENRSWNESDDRGILSTTSLDYTSVAALELATSLAFMHYKKELASVFRPFLRCLRWEAPWARGVLGTWAAKGLAQSLGKDAISELFEYLIWYHEKIDYPTDTDNPGDSRVMEAIVSIGEPAITPLIDRLGSCDEDETGVVVSILKSIESPSGQAVYEWMLNQDDFGHIHEKDLILTRFLRDSNHPKAVECFLRALVPWDKELSNQSEGEWIESFGFSDRADEILEMINSNDPAVQNGAGRYFRVYPSLDALRRLVEVGSEKFVTGVILEMEDDMADAPFYIYYNSAYSVRAIGRDAVRTLIDFLEQDHWATKASAMMILCTVMTIFEDVELVDSPTMQNLHSTFFVGEFSDNAEGMIYDCNPPYCDKWLTRVLAMAHFWSPVTNEWDIESIARAIKDSDDVQTWIEQFPEVKLVVENK